MAFRISLPVLFVMPLNGLRRNDAAMKIFAGIRPIRPKRSIQLQMRQAVGKPVQHKQFVNFVDPEFEKR